MYEFVKVFAVAAVVAVSMESWAGPRRVVVGEVSPARAIERRFAVTVSSKDAVSLSFPMSGRIAAFKVRKDMEVVKDQPLVELDSEELNQRILKARSAAAHAEESFERMKKVPRGVSADELSRAESQMAAARAELKIAEKALSDSVIRAPFSGIIVKTSGSVGQVISGGTPVIWVHSKAVMVSLFVPERYICRDDWQQRLAVPGVEVEVAACPGLRLPARFSSIDLVTDNKTQSYKAGYHIDTPKGYNFYEGMSATLFMPVMPTDGECGKLLEVPSDAICRHADGTAYVWLIAGGAGKWRASRCPVEIVTRNCTSVIIRGELAAGDKVAVLGNVFLTDGMQVEPEMVKGRK